MTKKFNKSNIRLPHTEQSQQYDNSLTIIKTQIDIMLNTNHGLYTWLNEVQAYLNRARDQAAELSYNQAREFYDE